MTEQGLTDELIAARKAVLAFSDRPGFTQALRRLERAAIAAGPRSPVVAQAPFANPPRPLPEPPACTFTAAVPAYTKLPLGQIGDYLAITREITGQTADVSPPCPFRCSCDSDGVSEEERCHSKCIPHTCTPACKDRARED